MLLAYVAACSQDEEASTEDEPVPLVHTEVPTMVLYEPDRASFIGDVDRVTVSGRVEPGTGALTSLVTNGNSLDVSPEGGDFDDEVSVGGGLVILGTRLETDDDERAVDGRAVIAGPVNEPGAELSESVLLQIGPELLDDDADDPDDLAYLAETMIEDDAIADAMVGTEYPTEYYTLVITSASWGDVDVDIVPASGSLGITLVVHDVWIDFDAIGECWACYDTYGSAWVDEAIIDMTLELEVDDGDVIASVTESQVTLQDFSVTVDWFPDFLEGYLADWVAGYLEDELATQIADMIPGFIETYLAAFSVDTEFGGMRFQMALAQLRVSTDGLLLTMDAWTSGDIAFDLPEGAGSPATDADGPSFPLTADAPFAMAADDDFVNQLLFNMWTSGILRDIVFSGVELTAIAGEIPAPLGPVAEAEIDLDLPPVFTEVTYEDQHFDLAMGELRMQVTREDGVLNDASINVRTGGTLAVDDDGELAMTLDARPAYMTLEVGMESWPEGLDPGDMAALIRLSVPPMFGTLSSFLPDFPVPTIPLDDFGYPGDELKITDPQVSVQEGWLVLEGGLSAE